jgi:DNA-binding IclR family transcriptional regulator
MSVLAWWRARRERQKTARRMAIVDALDDAPNGLPTHALAELVGRPTGTLHADLAWLERNAWIESWWHHGYTPKRRIYGRCRP